MKLQLLQLRESLRGARFAWGTLPAPCLVRNLIGSDGGEGGTVLSRRGGGGGGGGGG
eukprot:SAG31_NODE_37461_length_304_cov_0.746341_1_plen_56_part_01